MAGKPTIPSSVHTKIRRLHKNGSGLKAIAAQIGVSVWTVRKALDLGFAEAEAARHRARAAEQYANRKDKPSYIAYQAAANNSEFPPRN